MDRKSLQQPSFLAASLSCVLLLVVVVMLARQQEVPLAGSSTAELISNTSPSGAIHSESQAAEFQEAISLSEALLRKGEFAPAFDMVMVASRLAPSDPRLFDLVLQIIEKAAPSDDEEITAMAEDLLARADSLVYFQSPKDVRSSRKRIADLSKSFFAPTDSVPHESRFKSIINLLTVAENALVPINVRSRAAEQARSALDDAQLDLAIESVEHAQQSNSTEIQQLTIRLDKAEQQCIKELFLQLKPTKDKWIAATFDIAEDIENAASDKAAAYSTRLSQLLDQGFGHLQELMPYSKSGVEGAAGLSNAVEKQLKLLQRQKNWIYNQQVVRLVREIESKDDWTSEDKIMHLAEVSEELLAPYVLRRHNELWEKVFESLPNEEKKVWAVRLRILRLSE